MRKRTKPTARGKRRSPLGLAKGRCVCVQLRVSAAGALLRPLAWFRSAHCSAVLSASGCLYCSARADQTGGHQKKANGFVPIRSVHIDPILDR